MNVPPRHRGGVSGKWQSLNDEVEELREIRNIQQQHLQEARGRISRLEKLAGSDKTTLLDERDALKVELEEQAQRVRSEFVVLSEDEQEAMDALLAAFNIITNRWKLIANQSELTAAVHVIQGFIDQHMLHRLVPEKWASWWQRPQPQTKAPDEVAQTK